MTTAEKIYHVLIGVAYGDALGMPTENMTGEQISNRFGKVTEFLSAPSDGPINRSLPAGTVTDDTENTVFICRMLIDSQGQVDRERFLKYLMQWLEEDPNSANVTGPSTKAAVEAIKAGTPIEQAGIYGTTNGAAMKIAPIGLVTTYQDVPDLVQKVAEICVPTHNTQIAIQGASVVAAAVNFLFSEAEIDWDQFYDLIDDVIAESARYGNQLPTPSIAKRIAYGRHLADDYDEAEFFDELYHFLGTGLPTIETVPAAISLVYRNRGALKQSIEMAANIGGDTDTIAAICGAICGGYHFDLSTEKVGQLEQANTINFGELAEQLAEIVKDGGLAHVNKSL